ncbi:DUF3870 domain-containing protein [Brevibacillus ginsengisoli]|uniref:DUF3870 domain-containing protein n=1 Tax=Brevibacillus ginsengisoli TaxID=363854 RepID=UPI003CE90488
MSHSPFRYQSSNYILSTGFSQLPKGTPMSDVQKVFACSLVIDRDEGLVVDASFTFLMGLNEEFLRGLVIGHKLPENWNEMQKEIRLRFLTPTQGAILQAIHSAMDRYLEAVKQDTANQ